jgi:hypothetical protein
MLHEFYLSARNGKKLVCLEGSIFREDNDGIETEIEKLKKLRD